MACSDTSCMENFWKEETFLHGPWAGTKFTWPTDRPICFDGPNPDDSPTWLPTFSLDLEFIADTTVEQNLTAAVSHYVQLLEGGIAFDRKEIKKMNGQQYLDWVISYLQDKDLSNIPIHIHYVVIEGDDRHVAMFVDAAKRQPTTDFHSRNRHRDAERNRKCRDRLKDEDTNIFNALHKAVESRPDYDPNAKLEPISGPPLPFIQLTEEQIQWLKDNKDVFKDKKS